MRRWLNGAYVALVLSLVITALPVGSASSFADPAFQKQWQQLESAVPNFYGPLETARDGQRETYKEAPSGQRLVQYFDKARLELTVPALPTVSSGLLTVELKTGAVQTGDATFEQRQPALVGLVGDPGSAGPTYADLSQVPEKDGRPPSPIPTPYAFSNGKITGAQNLPARAAKIPFARLWYKTDDPAGRYSQYVFYPFWDFIQSLPVPFSQTTGYAIGPLIWVHATVGGKPADVLVQAFERRVLTWNENNDLGKEVEFGNIGQHYYQWRYGSVSAPAQNPSPSPSPTTTAGSTPLPGSGMGIDILQKGCSYTSEFSYCGFIVRNSGAVTTRYITLSYSIYDGSGALIASDNSYLGILHPGERGGTASGKGIPKGSSLSRVDVQVVEVKPLGKNPAILSLTTKEGNYIQGSYSNKIVLTVVNPNIMAARDVSMYAIFYDASGKIVGAGYETYLDPVPANGQRSGEITSVSTLKYDHFETFAYLDYQSTTGDYS